MLEELELESEAAGVVEAEVAGIDFHDWRAPDVGADEALDSGDRCGIELSCNGHRGSIILREMANCLYEK